MNLMLPLFRSFLIPLVLMVFFSGTLPITPSEVNEGGIEFEIETADTRMKAMVSSMKFNQQNKQIDIETKKSITSMEFLEHDGELIFWVPVGTPIVNIGIGSYPKGVYYLRLLLEEENDYITTKVIKDF